MRSPFILVVIGILLLVACGGSPKHSPLPPGSSVLAFGDSVTFGTGAAPGEDYPSRLATITGWAIRNGGVPGDTAEAARARIRAAIEEAKPALVILEIGGNDFLRKRPQNAVKEDIRHLLHAVRKAGVPVVLVAVPRFSLIGAAITGLPDADLYAELAKEEKVPLVPGVFAAVLSDPALKSDAIHPNAAGYGRLAEGIADGLAKVGLLVRK